MSKAVTGGTVTVVPAGPIAPVVTSADHATGWWDRYRSALAERMSPAGLEVLEADARYIVHGALPMNDQGVDTAAWPEGRVRTGMVVGSVQSGKTASMLAVASLFLDGGVDIVVLLAGTRVGLWLQTYERLLAQLDGSTRETAWQRSSQRLILPQPDDVLNDLRAEPTRYLNKPKARAALARKVPIIFVVPKEDDHLLHLARFLKEVLSDQVLSARDSPVTMMLLDDEADDASVLDSAASGKITPRYIVALWSGDAHEHATRHPNLLATYLAYTATPQANYLQATHNPLAPRDLHAALRLPSEKGAQRPRELTFEEPAGIAGYYCGGDIFYEKLAATSGPLCAATPFPIIRDFETQADFAARQERTRWDMIGNALRAYLVAGAARLVQAGRSFEAIEGQIFASLGDLTAVQPPTHTMLFHPSARKELHFKGAADLVRWSLSLPGQEAATAVPEDDRGEQILEMSAEGLAARLLAEEDLWQAWLERFEQSRRALSLLPRAPYKPCPAALWPQIREALLTEVFPNIALRVLNSDPAADDRPQFQPRTAEGGVLAPADIFTIFVAGNVLSRGLTLEGLCTSLFLRGANEPAADTQMQMQRWFGYRGPHLPFCRVILFSDQQELFRRYNVNDAALKWQIMRGMEGEDVGPARSMLVLQGAQFVATSKVDSRRVPLNPGPRPSVKLVECASADHVESNTKLLRDLLGTGAWVDLCGPGGTKRGLIRKEPASLIELATWLERFRYSGHDPDPTLELSRRWLHLGESLKLDEPLFRPPGAAATGYASEPQACPYSIAAYFRLWHALLNGNLSPGFYPTDKPRTTWTFDDAAQEPKFFLALRFGANAATDPWLARRGVLAMTRQVGVGGRLETLWGTRGYGDKYFGDELVDYHYHGVTPVPSIQGGGSWRPRGHPGMALFHLITSPDGGSDMVTVGLGVPHGGPDHIAALRG